MTKAPAAYLGAYCSSVVRLVMWDPDTTGSTWSDLLASAFAGVGHLSRHQAMEGLNLEEPEMLLPTAPCGFHGA